MYAQEVDVSSLRFVTTGLNVAGEVYQGTPTSEYEVYRTAFSTRGLSAEYSHTDSTFIALNGVRVGRSASNFSCLSS